MSDTVIAATITAIGTILVALITSAAKARSHRREGSDTLPDLQPASRMNRCESNDLPVVSPPSLKGGVSRLTHKQIVDVIEAVPPFQQQGIHANFIGAHVTWHTKLSGIHRNRDEATVYAEVPEGDGVLFCEAPADQCVGFMLAPEGTEFTVFGEIEKISRYEATLKNCSFEINQHCEVPPPPSTGQGERC